MHHGFHCSSDLSKLYSVFQCEMESDGRNLESKENWFSNRVHSFSFVCTLISSALLTALGGIMPGILARPIRRGRCMI